MFSLDGTFQRSIPTHHWRKLGRQGHAVRVIQVGVVAPELLRSNAVHRHRALGCIARVEKIGVSSKAQPCPARSSIGKLRSTLGLLVVESVAASPGDGEAFAKTSSYSCTDREPFDAIHSHEIRYLSLIHI